MPSVADETVELDELTVTVVVDNATDTLSSIAPGSPQVPEVAFLLGGSLRPATTTVTTGRHVRPPLRRLPRLLRPGHGASRATGARRYCSTWARTATSGWPTPNGWPSTWPASTCSSSPTGTGTTPAASRPWSRPSPRRARLPASRRSLVDVHPDRPDQRGMLTPLGKFAMLPEEPTFEAIEAAGGQIVRHAEAHTVGGGLFLASGDIPRADQLRDRTAGATTPGATAGPPRTRRSTTSASSRPASAVAAPRSSPPAPTRASSTSASRHDGSSRAAGRPAAGWLPPRRRRRRAPHRPDREGPHRPRPAAVRRARSLHRLARGDRPRGTPSARPATRRASWGPATCSLPRPDDRGQE